MWNLVSSNRILDLKWKHQCQQKHLKSLRDMKSKLNTSAPKQYSFLQSRPKARQTKFEKQREIDEKNSLLVHKMLNTTSNIKNQNGFFKDSLNCVYNRKVDKQIDDSNHELVRRLQTAKSQYSQRGMARSVRHYDKVKSNIAFSRMDPFYDLEPRTKQSTQLLEEKNSRKLRPYSAKI